MATEQQLKQALIQAHNNGDTQAAELFASKIKQLRSTNQGGNGVQTSPSQPVVDAPQPIEQRSTEFDPINTDRAIGGLEGAASMISGMVAEPIAGLSGLVAAVLACSERIIFCKRRFHEILFHHVSFHRGQPNCLHSDDGGVDQGSRCKGI